MTVNPTMDEIIGEALNRPQTNADRIRSMTDEELAEFIYDKNEDGSREAWLEWLKKEVDE